MPQVNFCQILNSKLMQVKKNPKKNLNRNSMLYFQIGLCLVLLAVFISAEWKSYSKPVQTETVLIDPIVFEDTYIVKLPKKELPIKGIEEPKKDDFVPEKPNDKDDTTKEPLLQLKKESAVDHTKVLDSLIPAIPEPPEDVPFDFVQDVPIFPGCERFIDNTERKACMQNKLSKFVKKHFDTRLAEEYGINGRNRIDTQFKVMTTGEIEFMNVRAPHPKLEEEARRLIEKLPKMQPGKQRDKPVNVIFSLPINFQVQD